MARDVGENARADRRDRPPHLSAEERWRRRGQWSPLDRLGPDPSQGWDARLETEIGLPLAAVTQVREHGDGEPGDCLRASVASIFGMAVEDVPHFALHGEGMEPPDKHVWWFAYVGFCASLSPSYEVLTFPKGEPPPCSNDIDDLYGCYIATGKSPRGDWNHCVVGRGGVTIWDPHPSRDGIDGEPIEYEAFVRRETTISRVRWAHHLLPTERAEAAS